MTARSQPKPVVVPLNALPGDPRIGVVREAARTLAASVALAVVLLVEMSPEAAPAGVVVLEGMAWEGPRYVRAGPVRFFVLTPPEWADVQAGNRSLEAGFEGPLTNVPPE